MAVREEQIPLTERAKRFLAGHGGNAETAIAALLKDNLSYRVKLRAARDSAPYKPDDSLVQENEQLRGENDRLAALVPASGAVILTGDDAMAWPKYKALNLAPDKITAALTERDTLATQLANRSRREIAVDAAEKLGYKPTVLADLITTKGLHVEMKDVTEKQDGKSVTTKVPHVRPAADEKAAFETLEAYVGRELKDYLPALTAVAAGEEVEGESDEDLVGAGKGGVEFPAQRNGRAPITPSRDKQLDRARSTGEYAF